MRRIVIALVLLLTGVAWAQRDIRVNDTSPKYGDQCDARRAKQFRTADTDAVFICDDDLHATSGVGLWAPAERAGQRIYNVEDFGANGTDILDDAAAFQLLLDSLPTTRSATMVIPSGTYYMQSTVDVPDIDDLTITCEQGATLRIDGAGVFALKANCGGTCRGLTIEGCHFYDPDPPAHVGAEESHGMVIQDWDDVTLARNRCTDIGDECVDLLRVDGFLVESFVVSGTPNQSGAGAAISANQSQNGAFIGNRVSNVPDGGGIGIESTADDGDKTNIRFERNTIDTTSNGAQGIRVNTANAQWTRIAVEANVFLDVDGPAISILPTTSSTVEHVTIRGNQIVGGGRGMSFGGGVKRGCIQVAEGVRFGEISGNTVTDCGVRDVDCAVGTEYGCCAGAGDAGLCGSSHNALRVAEDGFTVANNVIRDVPRGISSDGDHMFRCSTAPTEKCGKSSTAHCAVGSGDCELETYLGNIYDSNQVTDFDVVGIAPRGTDIVDGGIIQSGASGIQVETAPIASLIATVAVRGVTVSGMTDRGIGVKGSSIARENDIIACATGTVLSTTQDRCSYSGVDCDGGGTCSNDGTCVETVGGDGDDDGTCEVDETCECSGGWNDTKTCTEDLHCGEGTCTAVAQVWDYENRFVSVSNRRTNSAGTDAVIRETLKHWTAGSSPAGTESLQRITGSTDDQDKGFSVGSRWYDTSDAEEWVLLDPSDDAAIWAMTTTEGGTPSTAVTVGGDPVEVGGDPVVCATC